MFKLLDQYTNTANAQCSFFSARTIETMQQEALVTGLNIEDGYSVNTPRAQCDETHHHLTFGADMILEFPEYSLSVCPTMLFRAMY